MTTATRRRGLASAAVLSILFLAGACSSSGTDDARSAGDAPAAVDGGQADGADGGGTTGGKVERQAEAEAAGNQAAAFGDDAALTYSLDEASVADSVEAAAPVPAEDAPPVAEGGAAAEDQKLISNGAVQLKSDDVGKAIFDVRNVVDKYAGEVEANATETDDEGDPLRARLKLRVPTAQFDNVMQDLEGVATLIASSGNTEDVTTEVLDRSIRIQVQRRSIERISLLLDRAVSIRDVVAIEAQLSQRQADLDSLERTAAYLAGQTTMSTIVVSIDQIPEKKAAPKPETDETGFVSGFKAGWDALTTFAVGLATAFGAVLPWLAVLAILGYPIWLLVRVLRRRFTPSKPEQTPSAA